MKSILAKTLALMSVIASLQAAPPPPKMLSWSELTQMPLPPPAEKIAYDSGPQQFGELRLPKGEGPFPVVVLIHGGCWQNEFDYVYMTRLGAWFAEHGIASWTIEYRRLGDNGGGCTGTFLDIAHAADFVRQLSSITSIDSNRIIAAGHSTAIELALWLAGRGKLAAASELYLEESNRHSRRPEGSRQSLIWLSIGMDPMGAVMLQSSLCQLRQKKKFRSVTRIPLRPNGCLSAFRKFLYKAKAIRSSIPRWFAAMSIRQKNLAILLRFWRFRRSDILRLRFPSSRNEAFLCRCIAPSPPMSRFERVAICGGHMIDAPGAHGHAFPRSRQKQSDI